MANLANDRLVVSLDFLVDNSVKAIDLLQKKIGQLGTSLQKMGPRKLSSITDAVQSTFGAGGRAADEMGRAVQRTVGNINKLATAKTPFNLKDFGIDQLAPKINKVSGAQKILDQVTADANVQLKNQGKVLDSVKQKMAAASKGMGNLNAQFLGFGLALLFGGMAIKKFSQDMIRSITNAFTTLADSSNVGMKGILTLQASLQFLKYIIFDTFARTDMFANFVEGVVNIVNWISEFIQLHPGITKFVIAFLAVGVVLGGVIMIMGQLFLAAIGVASAFSIGIGGALGVLFILGAVIQILTAIWISDMSDISKVTLTIISVFIGILAVMALTSKSVKALGGIFIWLAKNPIVWFILAFAILLGALLVMGTRIGSVGDFFHLVLGGMIKGMHLFAALVFEHMTQPITDLIKLLQKLALAAGKTGIAAKLGAAAAITTSVKRQLIAGQLTKIANVDEDSKINEAREKLGVTGDDPLAALDALLGTSFAEAPDEKIGTGEEELAKATKATEDFEATDTSKDVARLADLETESLAEQKETKEEIKELREQLGKDGVNLKDDGITRLSKAMGVEISQEMVQALFDAGFSIVPSPDAN